MNNKYLIKVWPFEHAPDKYKKLSQNGGDEDWIAFVPDPLSDAYINWLECPAFGCFDVSEYKVSGGIIKIGAHS